MLMKIFQWNILADSQAISTSESGVTSSFITVPLKYLEWEYRFNKIIKQLIASNSDVICLQGVSHFEELITSLKDYYSGLFLAKPHSKDCGVAILYKTKSVRLVKYKELELPSNREVISVNEVALLTILELTVDGDEKRKEKICVTSTQLKSGQHYSETRLFQSDFLLDLIKKFAQGLPIICSGDFNASPTESVYGHFTSSRPPLASAHMKGKGSEPEYTVWRVSGSGEHKYTTDYIWYSWCNKLELVSVLCLIPFYSPDCHKGLPSVEWPSHHLAIEAQFNIK